MRARRIGRQRTPHMSCAHPRHRNPSAAQRRAMFAAVWFSSTLLDGTPSSGGAGLGLAICSALPKAMKRHDHHQCAEHSGIGSLRMGTSAADAAPHDYRAKSGEFALFAPLAPRFGRED